MNPILEIPAISRIRRNHGLEHATIHVLTEKKKPLSVAGHSDAGGFWILGELGTEELLEAAQEALARLNNGEHDLAVHPNCGTNFATYGIFAGLGSFLALSGAKKFKDRLDRLPLAALLATVALILSQPVAYRLQREVTTSGRMFDLSITRITRTFIGNRTAHRIETKG
ncbi:MAG TPA: DUF6391 domain-containing protein [Anaerolineales bacterium]|nr:DUF6391 domain-containing protein [Anaerolineales bacterium]